MVRAFLDFTGMFIGVEGEARLKMQKSAFSAAIWSYPLWKKINERYLNLKVTKFLNILMVKCA
ncbi:hypothetical protein A8F94_04290 [Bacillus sp. FJAT-27225]|nr:hypothetical protein A8F94_04290 [Bacillus sp. FJAT-27225]